MEVKDLLTLPEDDRRWIMARLSDGAKEALSYQIEHMKAASPFAKYGGDIERIIMEGFGEGLWSKQREILASFKTNQRTCVVTTPGVGKTAFVAMLVCALVAANLEHPERVRVITTANKFQQIKTQIWYYILNNARRYGLPGARSKMGPERLTTTSWYLDDVLVADGIAAADQDENAMRGFHALGQVVVIVDEASGISHTVGRALNGLLTTPADRLIVLGNPPTDTTDTWFEKYSNEAIVNTISIPYTETPNFTNEETPVCRQCGPYVDRHTISVHLTSPSVVDAVRSQYPDEADPYNQAFLYARFPTGSVSKAIPMQFLNNALPVMHEELNAKGEKIKVPDPEWVEKSQRRGPIRFGVDVASDGGDEFVIAKRTLFHGQIIHHSSGPANEDATIVAGICKKHILEAVEQHQKWGITEPILVNVDRNGVGWGVTSDLQKWATDNKLPVVVVGVMVGEKARFAHRFSKQRHEIWWNLRELLQDENTDITIEDSGEQGRSLVKQLNSPTYTTDASGRTVIETKIDMKKRGATSPDRADALLLAYYDSPSRRRNSLKPGMFPEIKQTNIHSAKNMFGA